jgi:hypothetical protein
LNIVQAGIRKTVVDVRLLDPVRDVQNLMLPAEKKAVDASWLRMAPELQTIGCGMAAHWWEAKSGA